jgi:hypothetical protein
MPVVVTPKTKRPAADASRRRIASQASLSGSAVGVAGIVRAMTGSILAAIHGYYPV